LKAAFLPNVSGARQALDPVDSTVDSLTAKARPSTTVRAKERSPKAGDLAKSSSSAVIPHLFF